MALASGRTAGASPAPGAPERSAPWIALAIIGAGLLVYSQTVARYPDEPFHLVAAQLAASGQRPYLDFFHQHPPLYVYLLAGWMRLFGQSWRSAHALSALLSAATILIVARSARRLVEGSGWELWAWVAAVLWLGLHSLVVQEGTVAHPYSLAMFCAAAAYHCTITRRSLAAGLCAGAATGASLLWAPVAPLLFLWLVVTTGEGRLRAAVRFAAGFAVAWLPVLRLALHDLWVVWFNLFEYHFVHRQRFVEGPGLEQNLRVFLWLARSSQGFFLLVLGAAAVGTAACRRWPRRQELYLAAGLTAAMWIYISSVRPTYFQYLIGVIPFAAALAPAGLRALGAHLPGAIPRAGLVLALTGLYVFGPVRFALHADWPFVWQLRERVTREATRLIPTHAVTYAPEWYYFLSRRLPPTGLNNNFGQMVEVSAEQRTRLHVVSKEQIEQSLREGRADALLIGGDQPSAEALRQVYRQVRPIESYLVLWEPRTAQSFLLDGRSR